MTQATAHILVVDDEVPIRTTMGDLLRRRGHDVFTAGSGEEALALLHERTFDLLLLDLKMPGMSGIAVAKRARTLQPEASVIILTGHGSLDTALDGIHLGVFDYLLKTASPRDVLARVDAALQQQQEARRHKHLLGTLHMVSRELRGEDGAASAPEETNERTIKIGNLHISTWRQQVRRDTQVLPLTPTEFRVLLCLAQQTGQVMTFQQIVQCVHGYETTSTEAAELIKPHIYHLRQKIEPDQTRLRYILTVRGTGYMLAAEPTS